MSGRVSYEKGKAAEDQVAQVYAREGYNILARRWRGPVGEIDLVVERDGEVVFIEVKAARSFARAALSLTQRQIKRIYQSAECFIGFMATGSLTPSRFDVALVNQWGKVDRITNAIGV